MANIIFGRIFPIIFMSLLMFQISSLASISTQVRFIAHPWSLSPVVKGQAGCSSSFLLGCIRCNPQDLSDHSSKTNVLGRLCNPFLWKMLVMKQLANEIESGVIRKVPQLNMEKLILLQHFEYGPCHYLSPNPITPQTEDWDSCVNAEKQERKNSAWNTI